MKHCCNQAEKRFNLLSDDSYAGAKALTAFKGRIAGSWGKIRIGDVRSDAEERVMIGNCLNVQVAVDLGDIRTDHVDVQVSHGLVDSTGMIVEGAAESLRERRKLSDARYEFSGSTSCSLSGMLGFSVRILPKNELLENPYIPGLIKWAG